MTYIIRDGKFIETVTSGSSALEALGLYVDANIPREQIETGLLVRAVGDELTALTRNHNITVRPLARRISA